MRDEFDELSDAALLERLSDCYADIPDTSGEVRSLLWDEILELQREQQRRYPPSTDPPEPT